MVAVGYLVLSVFVTLILLLGYRSVLQSSALSAHVRSKKLLTAVLIVAFWLGYLTLLSFTGVLLDLDMPPKFPILVFLPLVVGMIVFYSRKKNSAILHSIPRAWPIYFQSFRIAVELLILFTFFEGILPQSATFEGMNFDVLMGLSAPFVGMYVAKHPNSKTIQYVWNALGICMVLFVAFIIASSIYFPTIWNSDTPIVSMRFLEMPYLLLAGYLAPMAIFVHVLSLAQLRK
jgi:hypothetical protein